MFAENTRVVLLGIEGAPELEGELAIVTGRNIFEGCEVQLLRDHEPGSSSDPVRSFPESNMRLATPNEIREKIAAWEAEHNYRLPTTS